MSQNRKFPRISLKEQSCIIQSCGSFYAAGLEHRVGPAIITNLSLGGAQLKSKIQAKEQTIFDLQFPSIEDLESFTIKSEIVRSSLVAADSKPGNHVYLVGVRFVNPEVNIIDRFIRHAGSNKNVRDGGA